MMNRHIHILNQIPDYVLDLLPQGERQQVEQHTLTCADCRLRLRRESELGPLVRATLATAAQPPANLRQFMPLPKPSFWQTLGISMTWQKQLLPLTVVLLLFVGGFGVFLSEQQGGWTNPTPTSLAVTATMTDSPTAVLTETRAEQTMKLGPTAVSTIASQPKIAATPAPIPTPIAALPANRITN